MSGSAQRALRRRRQRIGEGLASAWHESLPLEDQARLEASFFSDDPEEHLDVFFELIGKYPPPALVEAEKGVEQ